MGRGSSSVCVVCAAILAVSACSSSKREGDDDSGEAGDAGSAGASSMAGVNAGGGREGSAGSSNAAGNGAGGTGANGAGTSGSTGGAATSGGASNAPSTGGSSGDSEGGVGAGSGGEGGEATKAVVCEGDFPLTTADAFADFVSRGCEIVTGSLAVVGIAGLEDLTGLETLREVKGNTSFSYNPDLGSLVGAGRLRRTTLLMLESNAVLTTPIGLEGLEEVEQLYVRDNPHFSNFIGLERLKLVTTVFHVENNPSFQSFEGLTALEASSGISVEDCPSLLDLRGLENLTSLVLMANRDASLESFAGLENLTYGGFQISDCPALADISALSNVTEAPFLQFRNTGISSVHGVENVKSSTYVHFWDNEKLTDLSALGKLETVSNSIQLIRNPALTSLTGLESVKTISVGLWIEENAALVELNFEGLTSVGSGIEIFSNPKLPKCQVDALLDQLGITCPMYCKDNDETGSCN